MASSVIKRNKGSIANYGSVTINANAHKSIDIEVDPKKFMIVPYQSGYSDGSQLEIVLSVLRNNANTQYIIGIRNLLDSQVTFNLAYAIFPI